MVSSPCCHPPGEDIWDRRASIPGFWVWMACGLSESNGTVTSRVRPCGSMSSGAASAGMNVLAVDGGRGACAIGRNGSGTICHGPSTR